MQSICESTGRLCASISRDLNVVPRRQLRKPSWLGFAKSKLYRVPKPLDWTKPEFYERQRLQQHHDTYMKSLWAFQKKAYQLSVEQSAAHAKQLSEDAEIGKIMEQIERDNAIARQRRETALLAEWKDVEENIIRERTAYEEKEKEQQALTEKEIKIQMERLKSSIKLEDLDSKIAEILSTTVDHNFAVDKTGKLYFGRMNSDKPAEDSSKRDDIHTLPS